MATRTLLGTPHSWTAITRAACLIVLTALTACGGGGADGGGGTGGGTSSTGSSGGTGGSTSIQPTIVATVLTFQAGAVPGGFLPAGYNSSANVSVVNPATNAPITNATITVDGVALNYVSGDQQYEGVLNVDPGAQVVVSVSANGVTYQATHTNFSTYPNITAPAANATWSPQASNLISWSGVVPDSTSEYAVGVFNSLGQLVWPGGNTLSSVAGDQNSILVPASMLTPNNSDVVLVGIVDFLTLPGAAGGSGVLIGAFSSAAVTIAANAGTAQGLTLSTTQATLAVGKSLPLTATASFTDGTHPDVTTRATWTSSDTSKVTVSDQGVISGIAAGTATVTAQFSGFSATATVKVFQPNPSPLPPLSQSVTYQIDYAHTGFATFGGNGPTFPPSAHWSTTLNGTTISYPLIAGGKVFVTTNAAPPGAMYGTTLYALDEVTGNVAWGPTSIPGLYSFSGAAYDHGTIFVLNFDGMLSSFDAATGTAGWTAQLPPVVTSAMSPPTAVNGIVYITSEQGVAAVDESNGNTLWIQGGSASNSAPAVTADGVFMSNPCAAFKFDPQVGTVLWQFFESCSGGGGKTVSVANNSVYVRGLLDSTNSLDGDLVLDTATGKQIGTFNADVIPAFSATASFMLYNAQLTATSLATGNTLWTFSGDGMLQSAPILIDDVVIIGSASGTVYALDAATGNVLWSGLAGAPVVGPNEGLVTVTTGLGAGEGYLIVPAGSTVSAWRLIP